MVVKPNFLGFALKASRSVPADVQSNRGKTFHGDATAATNRLVGTSQAQYSLMFLHNNMNFPPLWQQTNNDIDCFR